MPVEARLSEISHAEALRYLGFRGKDSSAEEADLCRCEAILRAAVRPGAVWRLMKIGPDGCLSGTSFKPEGESVRALLQNCDSVILMAATLGAETDLLIRRTQGRSLADAAVLDALANAAIENVCDNLCMDLAREMSPRALTPRFSPGYGDFPLSWQGAFFSVLNLTRRIGVTLTSSGLMVPQKTVTALMGVSDLPFAAAGTGCGSCRMAERCLYRKEGKVCGR